MILVTGGTGFVGTALLEALKAADIEFRAVSRSARDGFLPVGRFSATTDWDSALSGVETVVHLVARTHVMRETASDPLAVYREINVAASVRLAEEAARQGVRRFIFMSSIKVNGEETVPGKPFTAESLPRPDDAYGVSKLEAEEALKAIGARTGMEITIIRPPLIHGPGVKANFASLVRLATSGLPLPFGLVRNRRSLLHVGNLADFILAAIRHPQAGNRTFLLADEPALSLAELIRAIAAARGEKARLLPVPVTLLKMGLVLIGRKGIARRLFGSLEVDSSLARTVLGWQPPLTLEEGLRRTLGRN
nr:SDR family oxidoreductase [uncultured Gellertiella sp.]